MKLGLGIVQLGNEHGISNGDEAGHNEAAAIFRLALSSGVRILDTAAGYQESEQLLGNLLPEDHEFKIVTKTIPFLGVWEASVKASLLEENFLQSLAKMHAKSVYGMLVRHAADLLVSGGHLIYEKMLELKSRGLVSKIGVSALTADQIDRITDKFAMDIIQVPLSVLDQRLIASGHLARMKDAGIEIHCRSVFLHGLLLAEPLNLPHYFSPVKGHLLQYREGIRKMGLTPVEAALGFITGLDEVDAAICDVCNRGHLAKLLASYKPLGKHFDFGGFAIQDQAILNPSSWKI
ncbi:MAG: aldo/keto reductase [Nitrospiraceae bacterium]|nr:aldo/keto reductase [Nitrospiraceae bacterium]